MKKIIILTGIFLLTFGLFLVSVNADSKVTTVVDIEYEEYLEKNWAMVELSTKLQNRLMEYYNIKKQFEDKYPEYYGGIYISDDARSLVLQIIKENIPQEGTEDYKIYKELTTMDDAIKIEYVDNTFNELNEVNNIVAKNLNNIDNLAGGYIDVLNNTAVVELNKLNREKMMELRNGKSPIAMYFQKKQYNESLITFTQSKDIRLRSNINVGSKFIVQDGKGNGCSYGYRAKYNGEEGFVTAGHCFEKSTLFDAEYKNKGLRVYDIHFKDGGNGDYAFVSTKYSSYTPTNKLEYSSPDGTITKLAVVNYCPRITVNMEIAKSGHWTKYTTGKVTGLNKSYTFNGTTINGYVKSNVENDDGDSGGVVFIPRTDANGGAIPVGILSAGWGGVFGIGISMYFTDISNMPNYIRY